MPWQHRVLALAVICAVARGEECPAGCRCWPGSLHCTGVATADHRLTRDALANLGPLLQLTWTHSHIQTLDNDLFHALPNLEHIDLSGNEIRSIEQGLFSGLTRLKHLNISRNKIEDIPRPRFNYLSNCVVVDVSHNALHLIPLQLFEPMTRLQYLDLSYNKIVSISDFFFKPNRQLKSLFLNNNSLVKITPNALVDLEDLETLDVSSNRIDYIPKAVFDSLEQLRDLNLSYNLFQNISSDAFKNIRNLKRLNMGGNRLRQMPPYLFQHSVNLKILYLENTEVTVIQNTNFKGLSNLQELYIRNNRYLREIEDFVFRDTPAITHLDLTANALTFLPISMKNLDKLVDLRMEKNPWACDCRMEWFGNWTVERKDIVKSNLSCNNAYPNEMILTLQRIFCRAPKLVESTPLTLYRLQTHALLECKFEGNPAPSITWITPTRSVYHWNPDPLIPDIFKKHGVAHDQYYHPLDNRLDHSRVRVVENGSLHIVDIHREDTGTYLCFGTNPSGNVTAEVTLYIDPMTMFEIKINSLICGALCAAGFLALTLLVQALRYIFYRSVYCKHVKCN